MERDGGPRQGHKDRRSTISEVSVAFEARADGSCHLPQLLRSITLRREFRFRPNITIEPIEEIEDDELLEEFEVVSEEAAPLQLQRPMWR